MKSPHFEHKCGVFKLAQPSCICLYCLSIIYIYIIIYISIFNDYMVIRPGDQSSRTLHYKNFLIKLLKERNVKTVHDMACGTGIDSVMLLESGFDVSVKLEYEDTYWISI